MRALTRIQDQSLTQDFGHNPAAPHIPLLRWAGSKKKLLPLLERATPAQMKRYIEPFAGSAVLFLKLAPGRAILSDINRDLIETYCTVRDRPDEVWKRAVAWPTSESEYYRVRAMQPSRLSPTGKAARFIYLNRFCFNGVYRTNAKGEFNVARGKGHLSLPSREQFRMFAERLRVADLKCTDVCATVARARAGDFIYLDPPYAPTGGRDRGEYGLGSFKATDLGRLASSLQAATSRGAKVLLSYSDQESVIALFPDWHVHRLQVTRNVCGFTDARRRAQEVLISNYAW
jgi:DNA adenine methylase